MALWSLRNGRRSYLQEGLLDMRQMRQKIPGLSNVYSITEGDPKEEKGYHCWRKWMEFGEKTGCHQKPERSFFIHGYQMPVCARCFGVILGYLIAVPSFFIFGFLKMISLGGCVLMFADWLVQAAGLLKSTNYRRLITGILGGFGIMSIELFLIKKLILFIRK